MASGEQPAERWMFDSKRKAVTEQVTKAVKSAGGLVVAALAVACTALVVAVTALVLAIRRPANA